MQVLYLGRAPRTKETLLDFRKKFRVTRHSRVFRGLMGSHPTTPTHAHDLGNARVTWAREGEVATLFWRRDLDWKGWCRDII